LNIAVMTNPAAVPPGSIFMSGDDAQAKQTVRGLLNDRGLGHGAVRG